MAYTARLTKQQLRQRKVTRRVIDHVTIRKYLVTYAYTNNNCLLCASNIIVSVAIPTFLNPSQASPAPERYHISIYRNTSLAPEKPRIRSILKHLSGAGEVFILFRGRRSAYIHLSQLSGAGEALYPAL